MNLILVFLFPWLPSVCNLYPNWCRISVSFCSCLSDGFSWFSQWDICKSHSEDDQTVEQVFQRGCEVPRLRDTQILMRSLKLTLLWAGPLSISVTLSFCSSKYMMIVNSRPKGIQLCTLQWTQDRITLQMLKNFCCVRLLGLIQEILHLRVRTITNFLWVDEAII